MRDDDIYNRWGFGVFVLAMLCSLLFIAWVSFFYKGVDLKEVKKAQAQAEAEKTGQTKKEEKPSFDPDQVEAPWESTNALVNYGEGVYQNNCASCHGSKGRGNGPAAANLKPQPRDFIKGNWKKGGSAIDLYKTITNGIEGTAMAPFGHISKVKRWALVHYIRSLTENKVSTDKQKLEEFAKQAE